MARRPPRYGSPFEGWTFLHGGPLAWLAAPAFPWLADRPVDPQQVQSRMRTHKDVLGVPYSDEDIQQAPDKVKGKTEMEALIAYLQRLGANVQMGR